LALPVDSCRFGWLPAAGEGGSSRCRSLRGSRRHGIDPDAGQTPSAIQLLKPQVKVNLQRLRWEIANQHKRAFLVELGIFAQGGINQQSWAEVDFPRP